MITLVKLFETNEQQFRNELSAIKLPKDIKKLQKFMDDFFVNKVSVAEYKNELSMSEIAMLNSVMKLVSFPMSLVGEWTILNTVKKENLHRVEKLNINKNIQDIIDKIDLPIVGATAVGGLVGGLIFKTWGGVLLTIAGCVLGMCLSSNQTGNNNGADIEMKIDVNKYIATLKKVCRAIDEVMENYQSSIAGVVKSYDSVPKPTLASTYKPLLDRMASLYVAIDNETLPETIRSEFDKLYRTLKNHHYEIVNYSDNTRQYFVETPSVHISESTVIRAAILESGRLLETGECLVPEK